MSQWWSARFTIDGRTFATAEHYMMWAKATLFGDTTTADQILTAPHPHKAKTLGRQVRRFGQPSWETHRYAIVVDANLAEFSQHPDLRAYLLGTGTRILVEASPVDRIWGIGLAATRRAGYRGTSRRSPWGLRDASGRLRCRSPKCRSDQRLHWVWRAERPYETATGRGRRSIVKGELQVRALLDEFFQRVADIGLEALRIDLRPIEVVSAHHVQVVLVPPVD
ncbi:NADAR family protein [Plantactinospora sp. KBS50]|uniref:NADAR family protein n=1 Tax=Plantactinospora sp. KBS50 TaxID=2024580 RepID=UPI0035184226